MWNISKKIFVTFAELYWAGTNSVPGSAFPCSAGIKNRENKGFSKISRNQKR